MSGILIFRPERFWSKVDKTAEGGCWLWTGGIGQSGYGQITIKYQQLRAHRVSLELSVGPAPEGKPLAIHGCRNKHCVNPKHLRWGSHRENMGDRDKDGTTARHETHGMTKLTVAEVRHIFEAIGSKKIIAKQFGIDPAQVSHIKSGEHWGSITQGLVCGATRSHAFYVGENSATAKFSDALVRRVFLFKGTLAEIQKELGVSPACASQIRNRKHRVSATEGLVR